MQDQREQVLKNNTRNSNFELLRIIAMIMIVAHHFAVHGYFDLSSLNYVNLFWFNLFRNGGKIGVNLFVLISGYFLIDSTNFKLEKILKLWAQIFIYSVAIFIFMVIIGTPNLISKRKILTAILPIISKTWWFVSVYVVMFCFYPFINLLIKNINKKQHLTIILILAFIWSFLSTFLSVSFYWSDIGWFICLYFIATYIKKYGLNLKINPKLGICLFFILYIVFTLINSGLQFSRGSSIIYRILLKITNIGEISNFISLLLCILLFYSFHKLPPKTNSFVNLMGAGTFGVYLIHDNPLTRKWLWVDSFKNNVFQGTYLLIPYSILVTISVFIICLGLSIIYNLTLGHYVNYLINKLFKKFKNKKAK